MPPRVKGPGMPRNLTTARLEGERLDPRHRADLRQLHRNEQVMQELGGVRDDAATEDYLRRNLEHWATHGFGVWMLRERGGAEVIGRVILRSLTIAGVDEVEVGFAFRPEYWGHGYATEAGEYCLELARARLACRTVVAVTTRANIASQSVLGKLGLIYESDVTLDETLCALYRISWT